MKNYLRYLRNMREGNMVKSLLALHVLHVYINPFNTIYYIILVLPDNYYPPACSASNASRVDC